jgi:hypothetical protein
MDDGPLLRALEAKEEVVRLLEAVGREDVALQVLEQRRIRSLVGIGVGTCGRGAAREDRILVVEQSFEFGRHEGGILLGAFELGR